MLSGVEKCGLEKHAITYKNKIPRKIILKKKRKRKHHDTSSIHARPIEIRVESIF